MTRLGTSSGKTLVEEEMPAAAPAAPVTNFYSSSRPADRLVEFEQYATLNLTRRLAAGQDLTTAVRQLQGWKMRWTRGWTKSGRYTAQDIRAAWQRAIAAAQEAN